MRADCLTIKALDQEEDHLIVVAVDDRGEMLDEEAATRLLTLPARVVWMAMGAPSPQLDTLGAERRREIETKVSSRNAVWFGAEAEKLEGWADDRKLSLERELRELDKQIKEVRRAATAAGTPEEKLAQQKKIRTLEAQRSERRKALFAAQDEIDQQRQGLIDAIEAKLKQRNSLDPLFLIRWRLV